MMMMMMKLNNNSVLWQTTSRAWWKNISRSSSSSCTATITATGRSTVAKKSSVWNRRHTTTTTHGYTRPGIVASFMASTMMSTTTTIVLCDKKSNDASSDSDSFLDRLMKSSKDGTSFDFNASLDMIAKELGGQLQTAVDSGIPTQLSYGFVSGYCSGLALKKVGRMAATVFGLGFVVMQTLSYSGYIQVDHVKIRKDVEQYFDLDNDGDFDQEDAKLAYAKVLSVVEYNMPAGSGFGLGFLGGLKSG